MKRQLVLVTTIAVAVIAVACDGGSTGLSPSVPSASSGQASAQNLTPDQVQALSSACGFGDGGNVVVGTPPPDAPPPVTIPGTGGPVTIPGSGGTPPSGPPPAGAQLALGGAVENLGGSCPALTFGIHGTTVRTNATTSFGSGTCSSLKNGGTVGAIGTAAADGSIAATCVSGL